MNNCSEIIPWSEDPDLDTLAIEELARVSERDTDPVAYAVLSLRNELAWQRLNNESDVMPDRNPFKDGT